MDTGGSLSAPLLSASWGQPVAERMEGNREGVQGQVAGGGWPHSTGECLR